jgi:hypothetical protein
MQMQIVMPELEGRSRDERDPSQPFLSTVRDHLSARELITHRLKILSTYEKWIHAHENELENTKELARVTEELSRIDQSKRTPELVTLKNLEYTHSVSVSDAKFLIKDIANSLLTSNPFNILSRGKQPIDLGDSFKQLEVLELIRGDLTKRNRSHLKEASELIHYGLTRDAHDSIQSYERSLSPDLPTSEHLRHEIKAIRESIRNPGTLTETAQRLDQVYSQLPFVPGNGDHHKSLGNFKELCRRFGTSDFPFHGLTIPVRSDILDTNMTQLLLGSAGDFSDNPALKTLGSSLWDFTTPWNNQSVVLEPDMHLAHTLSAVSKRIRYLGQAYDKFLVETEQLSSDTDSSSLRKEAAGNMWAQYHHTEELLNQEITNLLDKRIQSLIMDSPDSQKTMEAFILISALIRSMNSADDEAYKNFLANADQNSVPHLPGSTRIFQYLENLITEQKIIISDEVLNQVTRINRNSNPEEIFTQLKNKYGQNFETAFDTYEYLQKELEPYNALFILLNQLPAHSKEHPLHTGNYSSGETARNNTSAYVQEIENNIQELMNRLQCGSADIQNLLTTFSEANPGNEEISQYVGRFKTRFQN